MANRIVRWWRTQFIQPAVQPKTEEEEWQEYVESFGARDTDDLWSLMLSGTIAEPPVYTSPKVYPSEQQPTLAISPELEGPKPAPIFVYSPHGENLVFSSLEELNEVERNEMAARKRKFKDENKSRKEIFERARRQAFGE